MKKLVFPFLAMLIAVNVSYAQWSGTAPGPVYYNGGNVGIGTTTPSQLLTVNGRIAASYLGLTGNFGIGSSTDARIYLQNTTPTTGQNWNITSETNGSFNLGIYGANPFQTITSNGYIGIGTTAPAAKLDVEGGTAYVNLDQLAGLGGQLTISNNYGNQNGAVRLNFNNGGAVSWIKGLVTGPNTNTGSALVFGVPANTADGTERMRIDASGNVAIGTAVPQGHKLAVNSDIIATKVTVKSYNNWPDYVFKPTYYLRPLSEVKAYIDQNHHLPEVPATATVEEEGMDVAEMNKILLKKVEELTLYLMDEHSKNQKQQQQINKLIKQVSFLKSK